MLCDGFWYNGNMITSLLGLLSHLLFIYLSHSLLISVIDWSKLVRGTAENQGKIRLLILFLAIALGYIVSGFFLDILSMSRSLVQGL